MIYCVEDDVSIREIEVYTLQSMGFEAVGFEDGQKFFEALEINTPELVLLDVMLPDLDGIEILKRIRKNHKTKEIPVIMATAKGAEIDKIQALDLGADDYLAKPFSMMEMVARVKAVLRRYIKDSPSTIEFKDLHIDESSYSVTLAGQSIDLTLKEYELLVLFIKHQGRAYSREQLLDKIWGTDYDCESRTVDVHIRTLRQKLGLMGNYIKTVRGVGYKLEI